VQIAVIEYVPAWAVSPQAIVAEPPDPIVNDRDETELFGVGGGAGVKPGTNVRVRVQVAPGMNWTTNVAFFPIWSDGGCSLTARSGADDSAVPDGLATAVGPIATDALGTSPLVDGETAKVEPADCEAAGPLPGRPAPVKTRVAATVSATTI
jgi:hypothetical protein